MTLISCLCIYYQMNYFPLHKFIQTLVQIWPFFYSNTVKGFLPAPLKVEHDYNLNKMLVPCQFLITLEHNYHVPEKRINGS